MARSQWTVKTVAQYGLFAIILILSYRIFKGDNAQKDKAAESDSIRPADSQKHHPRNVHAPHNDKTMEELDKAWGGVEEGEGGDHETWRKQIAKDNGMRVNQRVNLSGSRDHVDELVEEAGESGPNDQSRKREVNLGDLPRHKPHDNLDDLMMKKVKHAFAQEEDPHKKESKPFHDEGINMDRAKELEKRKGMYDERIDSKKETVDVEDFKDFHENEMEYLPFTTAGSHTTYPATLEFIYSIQYFYPYSEIAIYDIGLLPEEREFINSLCNVDVVSLLLHLWPEDMYKNRHRVWRPTLLQFAVAKFAHFVYLEPGRYINKQRLRDYIKHSHRHGITIAGSQQKYSTFSVTHPDMYTFLPVDETKIKKFPHFNFNMIIIHNTNRVKQYFMRYLLACTQEEYCIAPPGSKSGCDVNLGRSQRWANCHRYDESAMNIILNTWHDYKVDEYLMKDAITKHYDGKDVTKKLKICTPPVAKDL